MKAEVVSAASRKLLFLPHAIKQMSRSDRMITPDEIREAVFSGDVIEEYPDDKRGGSCLILHVMPNRPIHVVCSPKPEYLAIITAYLPSPEQWSPDFRTRK